MSTDTVLRDNGMEETTDRKSGPAITLNANEDSVGGGSIGKDGLQEDILRKPADAEENENNLVSKQQQNLPGEPSRASEGKNNDVNVGNTSNVDPDITGGMPSIPRQAEGNQSDQPPPLIANMASLILPTYSSRATDILMSVSISTDSTKAMILNLARCAMADLVTMCTKFYNPFDIRHFNQLHTSRIDQRFPRTQLQVEASREKSFIHTHRSALLELLMDPNRLAERFADIVSRATLLSTICPGTDDYDGTLQVMMAEFHTPSPLVPVREGYIVRYCMKMPPDSWGVVDISLESLFPYPASVRYRRRPSGCIIRELPDGCSKITWVELAEADNSSVPELFKGPICCGYTYGAQRWITALARENIVLQASRNILPVMTRCEMPISSEGIASLLKLVENMTREFFLNTSSTSTNIWMPLPLEGNENILISLKDKSPDFSLVGGRTFVLSTSVGIPQVSPQQSFSLLSDAKNLHKWDFLLQDKEVRDLATIMVHPSYRVSILEIDRPSIDNPDDKMFYLQKAYTDPSLSYVLHAPLDSAALLFLLSGGDPDSVAFLTSGVSMLPDRAIPLMGTSECGSLMTVMFHVLDNVPKDDDKYDISMNEIGIAHGLVSVTIELIKDIVARRDRGGNQ